MSPGAPRTRIEGKVKRRQEERPFASLSGAEEAASPLSNAKAGPAAVDGAAGGRTLPLLCC